MKKLFLLVFALFMMLSFTNCTQNQRAKTWGGNAKVEIPAGKHLVVATWKEDNLWLLVEKRPENVKPKTYQFYEESSWGLLEGSYTITEK